MNISFEHLKVFYNALKQKMKNSRGNWEQNDPTADDYIKNRPFYTDDVKEITIINTTVSPGGTSTNTYASSGGYQAIIEDSSLKNFNIGQEYSVIWDNVTYKCIAYMCNGLPVIGNAKIIGFSSSSSINTPFLIAINEKGGAGIVVFDIDSTHSVVVKTNREVIHKLDEKYLPEDIARKEDVDELTNAMDELTNAMYELLDSI